jgi:phage shock protein PspC (stress-responsive transcriptional regulator)
MSDMDGKMLVRKRDGRLVAGVCTGLADYFGIDANLVRLVFVVASFFMFIGVAAYLVGWAVIPDEAEKESIVERMVNKTKT